MYKRGNSKDRGEVYSLAYAAHNKINYSSSKEVMVDLIAEDLEELNDVEIVTFDVILLLAYILRMNIGDSIRGKNILRRFTHIAGIIRNR